MKTLIVALTLLLSINAFAKDAHLVCLSGHLVDMDIKIEALANGKEKLSVILTDMSGDKVRTFVNSNFENQSLSKGLADGKIQAVVSQSDLQRSLDEVFLAAGILELNYNPATQKNDVLFAAEGSVYPAACIEQ
jgi:hypothetical protein